MLKDTGRLALPASAGLLDLAAAPFDAFLTGSRYFECARATSDWDFIVQDTPETRAWLVNAGWGDWDVLAYADDGERDCMTNAVWEHGNVQVQLVRVAATKRRVRDAICDKHPTYHRQADTAERIRLWNAYYTLLTVPTE